MIYCSDARAFSLPIIEQNKSDNIIKNNNKRESPIVLSDSLSGNLYMLLCPKPWKWST